MAIDTALSERQLAKQDQDEIIAAILTAGVLANPNNTSLGPAIATSRFEAILDSVRKSRRN